MSYKEKPLLKLFRFENNSFKLQAIIDDYESCSFQHSFYEAGTFTIDINYNIPNSQLFEKDLFIQFGNNSQDFGVIVNISDSIGSDGKGSQKRNITGYDARYIFKRRIIKNLNNADTWIYTGSGELCMRNLIEDQCGINAESKRQLPIINTIPEEGIGSQYSVSEAYTNLYDVLVTIAIQTEIGWYVEFIDNQMILKFYKGNDLHSNVRFDTDYNSLSDASYEDSSESYSNAVYVGGKGNGTNKDIYEGEKLENDLSPSGLNRFESWDDSGTLDNDSDYENEAVNKLSEYSQTVSLSGKGLAKCPYVYREQYEVGDTITVSFSNKRAISKIVSLTEHWSWGQYDMEFEFGKPIQDLNRQLSLLISKIQTYQATSDSVKTSNVKYYTIPTDTHQPKYDVILDVIGFTGDISQNRTFTLYYDDESKTGAKTYHIYLKQLNGNGKLILTSGKAGSTTLELKGGTYVVIVYVDKDGNIYKGTGVSSTSELINDSGFVAKNSDGQIPVEVVTSEPGDDRKVLYTGNGPRFVLRTDKGGWASGSFYLNTEGEYIATIGVLGNNDKVSYYYLGNSYNDENGMRIYPTIYDVDTAKQIHPNLRQLWNGAMYPFDSIIWTWNITGRPTVTITNITSGYSASLSSCYRQGNDLFVRIIVTNNTTITSTNYGTQDIKINVSDGVVLPDLEVISVGYYGNNEIIGAYQGDYKGDNTSTSRGIRIRWQTHGVAFSSGSATRVVLRIPLTNYPLNA